MGVWDWLLGAYGRPGVSEACLALQDAYGQNVDLLLWAVWAETVDADQLARAAEIVRGWDDLAVTPLRAVRRALKAPAPPIDDAARESLRKEILGLELRAERVLLETLETLRDGKGGQAALAALQAASRAWGKSAPDDSLAELAAALD